MELNAKQEVRNYLQKIEAKEHEERMRLKWRSLQKQVLQDQ